jgi:hypothetical protein
MTADDAGRQVRWLCWHAGAVYVLGVAAMALIVALGRNDRLEAGGLLVATYVAINGYAAAAIAQALGLWPRACLAGLAWANRPLVVVSTLLLVAPIGVFTTGPTRPVATTALAGPVAVLLVRGYLANRRRTEWQR